MTRREVRCSVNGRAVAVEVAANRLLIDMLRDDLGLTGTKLVCDLGACGACTVLVDGRSINSCLTLAVEADGAAIMTIEGLQQNGRLHPLQQAFVDHGGMQCGYCTPGMILAAMALLDEHPRPTEAQIRLGLAGNLCRCTGYVKIIAAVRAAADGAAGDGAAP